MHTRIIITGGNGFVGRYLIRELNQANAALTIHSWDRAQPTNPKELPAITDIIDITSPATYLTKLQELQPAWIVHLAAVSSVEQSWQDSALTERINVDATRELLEAVERLSPATRVLAVSSADIYGQGSDAPLPELSLDQAQPQSPYAKSKWAMEKMIEEHFSHRVIRVRPFPHIGPGQARGFVTADFAAQIAAIESTFAEASNFAKATMDKSVDKGRAAVIKVGNLEAIRDFTDVRDVVRAYRLLINQGNVGEVYHVASGQGTSIQTILDELLRLATIDITVATDPARQRPVDIPALIGDASKVQTLTGWEPQIPLAQSLADILQWWRENVNQ